MLQLGDISFRPPLDRGIAATADENGNRVSGGGSNRGVDEVEELTVTVDDLPVEEGSYRAECGVGPPTRCRRIDAAHLELVAIFAPTPPPTPTPVLSRPGAASANEAICLAAIIGWRSANSHTPRCRWMRGSIPLDTANLRRTSERVATVVGDEQRRAA